MGPSTGHVVKHLRELLGEGAAVRDGVLLAAFAAARDEDAFAALVQRHGPMVFGLCKRVLHDPHDAEDAFQATFLVLARRAGAVRKPDSVAAWLHGVALRLARKLMVQAALRRRQERQAPPPGATMPADPSWQELHAALDEELARLPANQRLPLVLCYLEGLTQEEAAARLGWPRGTLKRRLERGREVLRSRLTRRGLSLAAALLATLPAGDALAVPPPAALSAAVPRAAALFALKKPLPASLAAAHVVTLAEGVLRIMLAAKLKWLVVTLCTLLGLGFGAVLLAQPGERPAAPGGEKPAGAAAVPEPIQPHRDGPPRGQPKPRGDAARLQGVWDIVEIETLKQPARSEGATVTFKGEEVVFEYGQVMVLKAKFKLDESKDPRWIDLSYHETTTPPGLPPVATPTVGAYKLDGDKLTLGLGTPAGAPESNGLPRAGRPVGFDTSPGTGAMVLRLVRRGDRKKADDKGIPVLRQWKGYYGSEHNQVRVVVRDEKQWEAVWAKSMGAKKEAPVAPEPQPLEKVDFTKHMVLAVFMGDRVNGGHVIEITRIVPTADGWTVYVREQSPPPGAPPKVTQQPFCLVVVPRFEGKVTFVNEDRPDKAARPPDAEKGEEVLIRKQWTQELSRWQKKGDMVARTLDEWKVAWERASDASLPVPPPPEIDLEKEMAVAVFMGMQGSSGHGVKITRVVRTELELHVFVRYSHPGKGQNVQDIETYPGCLAIVPRFNGKVVFIEDVAAGARERKSGPLDQQTRLKLDEILKEVEDRPGQKLAGQAMTLDQARELAGVSDGLVWQFEYKGWFVFCADWQGAPWFWTQAVFVKRGSDRARYWKETW